MPKKRTDLDRAKIAARIKAGETRKQIADSYGMSASSLSHWCRANGVDKAAGNITIDDRQALPDGVEVRTIDDLPGLIFAADGRIYSSRSDPPREVQGTHKSDGRIRLNIGTRAINLSREMCRAWHGAPEPGNVVQFHDRDRSNLRPENLYWASQKLISNVDFVRAWQTSESAAEVADKLGMVPSSVYARSIRLREHGVKLKDLSQSVNWDQLAKLADELGQID